jgi:hypothetical protein
MLFLTGLPRSGTSWAANALTRALGAHLDFEPFNWKTKQDEGLKRWHMLQLTEPAPEFDAVVETTRDGDRPHVVKDVHTCLALERWARVHPRVVILVRHPCAVAASWESLDYPIGWQTEILLAQPVLTDGPLAPFVDHLQPTGDFWFDLGAYWGAANLCMIEQAAGHDWPVLTHESLCTGDPAAFAPALDGLPGDESALLSFLVEADAEPVSGDRYAILRNTRAEPEKWRQLLDADQQAAVLRGAEPFGVGQSLYGW